MEKAERLSDLKIVLNSDCYTLWAMYRSNRNLKGISLTGLSTVFPIIPKHIHTLTTQYHYMRTIKQAGSVPSPG